MKAVVYDTYGPPEILRLEDVERPVPKEDEALVKVFATAVTLGGLRDSRSQPTQRPGRLDCQPTHFGRPPTKTANPRQRVRRRGPSSRRGGQRLRLRRSGTSLRSGCNR